MIADRLPYDQATPVPISGAALSASLARHTLDGICLSLPHLEHSLVACFIYLRRSPERFREMMCGVLVVTFFGLLDYLLVPAVGPVYALRAHHTIPLDQPLVVFNRQAEFMDFARIRRDVFPSLHVGIAFVVWLYAYRNSKRLFWVLSPLILSLWVSTVYLRYHYLVDCIAGLILAPLSFLLANWLFKRVGETVIRLPVGWLCRLTRVANRRTSPGVKELNPPG
jgi:membrane-associated phospholipid phosphatase